MYLLVCLFACFPAMPSEDAVADAVVMVTWTEATCRPQKIKSGKFSKKDHQAIV